MKKSEINVFIEEMEELGDVWEAEDVERVYEDVSLEEALEDRKVAVGAFYNVVGKLLQ